MNDTGQIQSSSSEKKQSGGLMVSDILMVVVALTCGAIGGAGYSKYMDKSEGPKIAVIDTIKGMQAIDPKDPDAEIKVTRLAERIKTMAAEYAARGYIVLDASYVLTMPEGSLIPLSGGGDEAK